MTYLILFTASFPNEGSAEFNFLNKEIPYLKAAFDHVLVVPERRADRTDTRTPPVDVDNSYAETLHSHGRNRVFLRGIFSAYVYREIFLKPSILFKPSFLKHLLYFCGQVEFTRDWVLRFMRLSGLKGRDVLFYTYWFTHNALGIGATKRVFPDLKLVSRAHGYDLYEERHQPPYWPCREMTLEALEFLYTDSDAGMQYMHEHYPVFARRIGTARLGIEDPGVRSPASTDGVYRIVSCSFMVPVKRLDLLMKGIASAAVQRPSQRFEWVHFGTGPLESMLREMTPGLPSNVHVSFPGYSTQSDLFSYYGQHPVDVFMNVSKSEGTPVAVMEAISCGIPVIATGVGGNTEIVSSRNGQLLSPNPSPDEIAAALLVHWDHPGEKRTGSYELWREKYDASRNFSEFAQKIKELRIQS